MKLALALRTKLNKCNALERAPSTARVPLRNGCVRAAALEGSCANTRSRPSALQRHSLWLDCAGSRAIVHNSGVVMSRVRHQRGRALWALLPQDLLQPWQRGAVAPSSTRFLTDDQRIPDPPVLVLRLRRWTKRAGEPMMTGGEWRNGRRASLRSWCRQRRVSSSLTSPTINVRLLGYRCTHESHPHAGAKEQRAP